MTTTTENKKISRVFTKTQINGMVKSLKSAKFPSGKAIFTIEKTPETIVVTHSKAGEVFRAIKGNGGWLTRLNDNLFA